MNKTIRFYKLFLETRSQGSLFASPDTTLQSEVKKFIENHTESQRIYNNGRDIIQIIDIDDDYIFGTFGKLQDMLKDDLIRGRNRKDHALSNIEDLIENYTYFYLDLTSNNIAIIYNSKARSFKTAFQDFISLHFRVSGIYEKIEVVNYKEEDLENIFDKTSEVLSASIKFTDGTIPDNELINFAEMIDVENSFIQNATVRIQFTPEVNEERANEESLLKRIYRKVTRDNSYESMKVETDKETIDFIENTISKKINIEIDEDHIDDEEAIRDLLKEQLEFI